MPEDAGLASVDAREGTGSRCLEVSLNGEYKRGKAGILANAGELVPSAP
jgi:hypothetical protein